METIPIKAVIANYFIKNPKKKEITFKDLSHLKSNLETKFKGKNILAHIRYSRDDLINLAKNYPESFQVDFDSKTIKYLNDKNNIYLMGSIPHNIKKDYFKLFSEIN